MMARCSSGMVSTASAIAVSTSAILARRCSAVRDVEVVTLYSDALGAPGSGAETYLDPLTTNARLIADALETP